MKKRTTMILLAVLCCHAFAQDSLDTPVGGVAVHLTQEQQEKLDLRTARFRDEEWLAQPTIDYTGIIDVGVAHRIDEDTLVKRLREAHDAWTSWKSGNASIDTSTAFDVLRIPFFPGEPVFELKYVDTLGENYHVLQINHAPWLDWITIGVSCESGACEINTVDTGNNSTLVPRKVYWLYRLGNGVWQAIQVQRG